MQPDVAHAQAGTLLDWSSQWKVDSVEGCTEVAFLLTRAATMIQRIARDEPVEVSEAAPIAEPVVELREG